MMFTELLSRRCFHFAPSTKPRFTGFASCFVVFPTHLLRDLQTISEELAMNRLSQPRRCLFFRQLAGPVLPVGSASEVSQIGPGLKVELS